MVKFWTIVRIIDATFFYEFNAVEPPADGNFVSARRWVTPIYKTRKVAFWGFFKIEGWLYTKRSLSLSLSLSQIPCHSGVLPKKKARNFSEKQTCFC
jgi:hypothetical protein